MQYCGRLTFFLGHVLLVRFRRKSRALLELLASSPFYRLRICVAILCCCSVPFRSRTSMYAPCKVLTAPCLACALHRFCGLRIYFAFHRRAVATFGHVLLVRSLQVFRALLELLASSSFNFRVSYRAKSSVSQIQISTTIQYLRDATTFRKE